MLLVLSWVPILKQQFDCWSYKMATDVKSINIKNWTYYFFDGMVNLSNLDWSLWKIDKMSHKDIDVYYIGYITIKKFSDYRNIHVYILYTW